MSKYLWLWMCHVPKNKEHFFSIFCNLGEMRCILGFGLYGKPKQQVFSFQKKIKN